MHTVASRRVLVDGKLVPAAVTIHHGRIVAVSAPGGGQGPVEDLGDLVLMPALVDAHVHVNEPGRTEWEGFASATRAAAAGGVATLVDMPLNSIPVTTSVAALHEKIEAARGQLAVNVAFWGGVVPGNQGELGAMARAGARGFKCFLCPSGIDDFPRSERADLERAMPILREAGRPLLVHAELEDELLRVEGDPRAYSTYLHSRPKAWEDRAVAMVVELVRATGCRAHVVHLSSSTALPIVAAAKREGLPVTAETCPHYLCLRAEEVPEGDTSYKCAPPVREDGNREALWAALASGTLDFVVSDHSPCIPALKRLDTGNFLDAWGGIASLQLGLRAVWTEARRRGHDVATVSRWMTAGPAALAGLGDRVAIAVGQRADLVAWDPEHEGRVNVAELFHRHPLTPYRDRHLAGRVARTWLGGELVFDGKLVGPPRGEPVLLE